MRVDAAIVCFGEVLLRLSAPGAERLLQTPTLAVAYGGAEANVAASLARFGHDVRMVSVLPDTALGHAVLGELRRHGVDTRLIRLASGRLGLYFLAPGAGLRAAEVIYDRAHSTFAEQDFSARNWNEALAGAGWFHVSGVTAALGQRAADAAIASVRAARDAGLTVSFDGNYRARLWQNWDSDAPAILRAIMSEADVLFGDHRDIGLALGATFAGVEPGRAAAEAAFAAFPRLQRIAHTLRVEHSVGRHDISAAMYARGEAWTAPAIAVTEIVDRIGAGDAFAAGTIHGLRHDWECEATLKFALMAAALKHTIPGDINLATEAEVLAAIADGGVSVRR